MGQEVIALVGVVSWHSNTTLESPQQQTLPPSQQGTATHCTPQLSPPNWNNLKEGNNYYWIKLEVVTPRRACAARGKVIALGLGMSAKKNLNLSKYSLSEVHSNTGRLLFEFNCLQYTLAAPEVFVAFVV